MYRITYYDADTNTNGNFETTETKVPQIQEMYESYQVRFADVKLWKWSPPVNNWQRIFFPV